jgi:hypothetical protein
MLNVRALFRKRFGVSAAALSPRPKPRPAFKPQLEELEERWLLDATTDTLMWKPVLGGNTLASNAANWYDENQGKPGVIAPTATNPIEFDGSVANTVITWDQNFTVNLIALQNKYTAQMTLNTGVVLSAGSINGQSTSSLNVAYNAPSSTMAIRLGGTSQLSNLNLSGQDGTFEISGGTMTLGASSNKSDSTIEVYDGTILNLGSGASLQMLQGAKLDINQGATLNVNGIRGGTALSNDGSAGAILASAGTVNINGTSGGPLITLAIPVLNNGVFNVNGGGSSLQAGSPVEINGQDNLTNNSDLDMTGGQVNLSGATTLALDHSYTQTAGTLETTDSLAETFFIGNNGVLGNATVSGGNIKMGTASTYGELDVTCAAFNMSGEYDPKVNGATNGQQDKLVFKLGFLNNQNGSTISVTLVGQKPAQGNVYTVVQGSTKPLQNFTNTNLAGLTLNANQLANGNYELDQQ